MSTHKHKMTLPGHRCRFRSRSPPPSAESLPTEIGEGGVAAPLCGSPPSSTTAASLLSGRSVGSRRAPPPPSFRHAHRPPRRLFLCRRCSGGSTEAPPAFLLYYPPALPPLCRATVPVGSGERCRLSPPRHPASIAGPPLSAGSSRGCCRLRLHRRVTADARESRGEKKRRRTREERKR